MPKMKTHRGLKKRVKLTKNGKIKRAYANSQSKSKGQKRRLHKAAYAAPSNAAVIRKLVPLTERRLNCSYIENLFEQ
ncbi:MAG TPA: bL35 family ribosomal protein [Clostridia bacterium]|nr:bL35 family ribosomal protein [Clostridia bacterium]